MKSNKRSRPILFLVLFALLALTAIFSLEMVSPRVRAFFNRVTRTDIYSPVSDELRVNLWEKGATVTIPFTPPFANEYVLALIFKEKSPPFLFKPQGKFLIRYYQGDSLVREHEYSNQTPGSGDPHGQSKLIVLDIFVSPQRGGATSHRAEIQVLEPDFRLEEYKDSMRIIVCGSPYW